MKSQHVKGSKTPSKSRRQYFCDIFWSLWNNLSSKNSFLVVPEILRLFDNMWTSDDKNSLSVKGRLQRNQLKYNYLQNWKYFLNYILHFKNLHQTLNILKKEMNLITDVFPKLKTAKSVVT